MISRRDRRLHHHDRVLVRVADDVGPDPGDGAVGGEGIGHGAPPDGTRAQRAALPPVAGSVPR